MSCEAYATLDDVKAQLNKITTSDDAVLLLILPAATKAIDRFCKRPDGFLADTVASARVYTADGGTVLYIDECAEVTLVAVKDSATETTYTSWAPGDWIPFAGDPARPEFNPTAKGKPYHAVMVSATGNQSHFLSGSYSHLQGFRPTTIGFRGVPTVQVTAKWGYSTTIPPNIRQACIVQTARWFRRGLGQWADAVGNPQMGQMFLYRRPVDPAVQMLLINGGYKRTGF